MSYAFKTKNLSYCYVSRSTGKVELLSDINIEVPPAKFFAVVGPNGAGKTTLFKLLATELKPCSGEVFYYGERIDRLNNQKRAQQIAVLPQQYTLEFDFWVDEVISLGRLPHTTSADKSRQVVDHVLDLLDITHLKERKYPALSGGEKQRVQLARVLAQIYDEQDLRGKTLLLDEPTTALDLLHQHDLLNLLNKLKLKGLTIVSIIHDLQLVSLYADEILMLKNGKKVFVGSIDDGLSEIRIKQVFNVNCEIFLHSRLQRKIIII